MTDSVADLLTRIRNAQRAGQHSVKIPGSKLGQRILGVLTKEGFIQGFDREESEGRVNLAVRLKYYQNGDPAISLCKRDSKPGRRIYKGKGDLHKVEQGLGILILSTSSGVMSDREARSRGVGGEVLATIA